MYLVLKRSTHIEKIYLLFFVSIIEDEDFMMMMSPLMTRKNINYLKIKRSIIKNVQMILKIVFKNKQT